MLRRLTLILPVIFFLASCAHQDKEPARDIAQYRGVQSAAEVITRVLTNVGESAFREAGGIVERLAQSSGKFSNEQIAQIRQAIDAGDTAALLRAINQVDPMDASFVKTRFVQRLLTASVIRNQDLRAAIQALDDPHLVALRAVGQNAEQQGATFLRGSQAGIDTTTRTAAAIALQKNPDLAVHINRNVAQSAEEFIQAHGNTEYVRELISSLYLDRILYLTATEGRHAVMGPKACKNIDLEAMTVLARISNDLSLREPASSSRQFKDTLIESTARAIYGESNSLTRQSASSRVESLRRDPCKGTLH